MVSNMPTTITVLAVVLSGCRGGALGCHGNTFSCGVLRYLGYRSCCHTVSCDARHARPDRLRYRQSILVAIHPGPVSPVLQRVAPGYHPVSLSTIRSLDAAIATLPIVASSPGSILPAIAMATASCRRSRRQAALDLARLPCS